MAGLAMTFKILYRYIAQETGFRCKLAGCLVWISRLDRMVAVRMVSAGMRDDARDPLMEVDKARVCLKCNLAQFAIDSYLARMTNYATVAQRRSTPRHPLLAVTAGQHTQYGTVGGGRLWDL